MEVYFEKQLTHFSCKWTLKQSKISVIWKCENQENFDNIWGYCLGALFSPNHNYMIFPRLKLCTEKTAKSKKWQENM